MPASFTIRYRRRGLSPLEMVLALPFLLCIMALMVNFSDVACWKVRSLTVARQAVWGAAHGADRQYRSSGGLLAFRWEPGGD